MRTTSSTLENPSHDASTRGSVITGAFLRAAALLGLNGRQSARIIGTSEASISRMKNGDLTLVDSSKGFELAILFIRAFRSLDAMVGGNGEKARSWFEADNNYLMGRPVDQVQTVEGLTNVVRYLDAMRSRI